MNKLHHFDLSSLLDNEETINEYVRQVLEDGDTDELIRAIGYIAKARGMSQIAKQAGLGQKSLYKILAPGSKPRFETIHKVLSAIGFKLTLADH